MSTVRIQVRRGTASQWTSVNPILAAGEMGVESDSNLFKFGNGSSTWTALAYANNSDVAIGEISQDAVNQALAVGAGLTKTYNDGDNTITVEVDASYFNELAQDAVNTAIQAGVGITRVYNDDSNTITLTADDSVLATREYVAEQNAQLVNTADSAYLLAADLGMASGVASLNSSGYVPLTQLDLTAPVKTIVSNTLVGGRGSNVTHDAQAGTLTLSAPITGTGSVVVANNSEDNGMTVGLAATVNATTKLTTPLVETGAVNTTTIDATTATLGALTVSGNLTVNGTSTTVNSTNYTVQDPMIYIGEGNQSNVLDLGVVAAFNDGTYQHAGLVRDSSDATWKLFSGVTAEPGTTVDFTTYTKDSLELGNLFADAAQIGNVSNAELQRLDGVSSPIQAQIDAKISTVDAASTYAPKFSPTLSDVTLTGTITAPNNSIAGAAIQTETISNGQISLTADIAQSKIAGLPEAIAAKANIESPQFTGIVILPSTTSIGSVGATQIGYLDGLTSNVQTQINDAVSETASNYTALNGFIDANKTSADAAIASINTANGTQDVEIATKSPIESPTFTGTVTVPTLSVTGSATGITKTMVGLSNVDNTADADKPVSTATQTELDLKSPKADPTFTGTVTVPTLAVTTTATGITKSMVGLANVDNTSDADKPVSTATQTALDLKAPLAAPSFTGEANFESNVTIEGNLTVEGTTTTVNTSEVQIDDPLFYLAANQYDTNTRDIGITGAYGTVGGTEQDHLHTGLVKDVTDGKWKLFSNTPHPVNNVIDFTSAAYDTLKLGSLEATTVTPSSGVVFSDGTQTKVGVPSITTFATAISSSATLAAGEADKFVPLTGAVTITLPATGYSTGQSIDFYQASGTGAQFASTNSVVGTPGLKFRTTNSVVTAMKTSSGWLVFGDLSA